MIRLTYISQASKPFSSDSLLDLLRACRRSNSAKGITGVLLYSNDCFIQVLEGNTDLINQTFAKIKQDPRHKKVTELERTQITDRLFDQWSMGFEELNDSQLKQLNIQGINDFFDPEKQPREHFNHGLVSSLLRHFKSSYQQREAHEELPIHDEQHQSLVWFHKAIRLSVTVLAFLMVFVIFLGVTDVFYVIYEKLVLTDPFLVMTMEDILATFGAFLAVLIAIEIFLNISLYLRSDVIPVKLVVATALMAISRKVIVFDFKSLEADYIYASAVVVLALGITYYLLDKKDNPG